MIGLSFVRTATVFKDGWGGLPPSKMIQVNSCDGCPYNSEWKDVMLYNWGNLEDSMNIAVKFKNNGDYDQSKSPNGNQFAFHADRDCDLKF